MLHNVKHHNDENKTGISEHDGQVKKRRLMDFNIYLNCNSKTTFYSKFRCDSKNMISLSNDPYFKMLVLSTQLTRKICQILRLAKDTKSSQSISIRYKVKHLKQNSKNINNY